MNMRKRSWTNWLALVVVLGAGFSRVEAAPTSQTNLIVNGGFETTGGSTGAASWLPWWMETPKPADGSLNYAYRPTWNVDSLNTGDAKENIYAGVNVQRVINNWDPWYGGVKQVVLAPAGARVRLTAYGKLWTSANPWPAPSDTTVGARMFVGLDPTGSDNQFGGTVVWSGSISPHGVWQAVSVDATVGTGGKVGVFLGTDYRGNSRQFMASYWDEASLVVVSASGGTPAPGATAGPTNPLPPLPPFVMPTPQPDGTVIYIVQPGDSLWRIAANVGISLDQLKAMNGLTSNIVSAGQRLIIAQAAAPTQPPAPTAAPDAATPTTAPEATGEASGTQVASTGTSTICAMLYNDANGNGKRDAGESLVAGGQFAVVDTATGAPVQAYTTDGVNEPHCFTNLPPGAYTISSAAPAHYNSTGNSTYSLPLEAGMLANVEFGAQPGGSGAAVAGAGGNTRLRIALFGAAGIMFLLLAAGVAGFLFLRRGR